MSLSDRLWCWLPTFPRWQIVTLLLYHQASLMPGFQLSQMLSFGVLRKAFCPSVVWGEVFFFFLLLVLVSNTRSIRKASSALAGSGSWDTQECSQQQRWAGRGSYLEELEGYISWGTWALPPLPGAHDDFNTSSLPSVTPTAAALNSSQRLTAPTIPLKYRACPWSWATAVPRAWIAGTMLPIHASCSRLRASPSAPSARQRTSALCARCRWTMTLRNMMSLHLQCHKLLATRQEDLMAIQLPTDLE